MAFHSCIPGQPVPRLQPFCRNFPCDPRALMQSLTAFALALAFAAPSPAQTVQTVPEASATAGTIYSGSGKGDKTVGYAIAGAAGQTLSVDLSASNSSLCFNILPEGADEALFLGSTSGNVADSAFSAIHRYPQKHPQTGGIPAHLAGWCRTIGCPETLI